MNGERLVLVLHGDGACWFRWRGTECVGEVREPIDADGTDGCPWPGDGDRMLEVVLDSPLDELEPVRLAAAEGSPDGRIGPLRRRMLAWHLRRRHPDAGVHMAPPRALPLVASLSRSTLPREWTGYLEALQARGLTVGSLQSAIGLGQPSETAKVGSDVLSIVRGESAERHTLYRSGWPAFTRVTDAADGARDALAETLAHVAEVYGASAPQVRRVDRGEEMRRLARQALVAPRHRPVPDGAAPLLLERRSLDELRRLQVLTLATALIACATVFAAAVHGVHSARERARALAAGEATGAHVRALDASVAARHRDPEGAVDSLAFVDAREATRAVAPAVALRLLADVLTDRPAVRLDRLGWTLDESGDGGFTGDDARSVSFTRPSSVPPRTIGESRPADMYLVLAGRIVAADGLPLPVSERQRRFEAFVAALRERVGTENLHVALSPAAAAARDAGSGIVPAADYEIRLRHVPPATSG